MLTRGVPGSVMPMDFRILLQAEFERRRARNPRYSLRAFARYLATHHSMITRIFEGRRLTFPSVRALGARLGLTSAQINDALLHEQAHRVALIAAQPGFRADSRWIATRSGLSLDEVNVAVQLLVHTRRLSMTSATTWTTEPRQ